MGTFSSVWFLSFAAKVFLLSTWSNVGERVGGWVSGWAAADLLVQQPAHVRPPEALVRGVRVQRRVRVQVVEAVAAHPLSGVALQSVGSSSRVRDPHMRVSSMQLVQLVQEAHLRRDSGCSMQAELYIG